jgi:hypothetical protein
VGPIAFLVELLAAAGCAWLLLAGPGADQISGVLCHSEGADEPQAVAIAAAEAKREAEIARQKGGYLAGMRATQVRGRTKTSTPDPDYGKN